MSTETPEARHNRGAALAEKMLTNADLGDLAYLRSIEATMDKAKLEEFRALLFSPECRGVAGIRGAADMAVRKMREIAGARIAEGIVQKSWRAAT